MAYLASLFQLSSTVFDDQRLPIEYDGGGLVIRAKESWVAYAFVRWCRLARWPGAPLQRLGACSQATPRDQHDDRYETPWPRDRPVADL
jgi:hypothetical protein